MSTDFYDQNIAYLQDVAETELKLLLAQGFRWLNNNKFAPLKFREDPSVASQMSGLFSKLDLVSQDKFRRAVTATIGNWLVDTSSRDSIQRDVSALKQLIYLSELLRLQETTPYLRAALADGRFDELSEPDYETLLVEVLEAIIHFADFDLKTNQRFFERLFYSTGDRFNQRIDDRYADILFVGLCKCNPDGYPDYLLRFLDIVERNPRNRFRLDHTFSEFAELITLKCFGDHFNEIPAGKHKIIWKYLCHNSDWAPFAFEFVDGSDSPYDIYSIRLVEYIAPSVIYLTHNPNLPFGYEPMKIVIYDRNIQATHRNYVGIFPEVENFSNGTWIQNLTQKAEWCESRWKYNDMDQAA